MEETEDAIKIMKHKLDSTQHFLDWRQNKTGEPLKENVKTSGHLDIINKITKLTVSSSANKTNGSLSGSGKFI